MRWSESLAGAYIDKGFALENPISIGFGDTQNLAITPQPGGGAVGWVFRPGSQVVIRNVGPTSANVSYHALIGYETRD